LTLRIVRAFQEHPATVGETYFEHLRSALGFTATMARAAVCCGIHAFLPFLFQRAGSDAIDDLHRRMIRQRSREQRAIAASPTGTAALEGRESRSAA
jgi:hypothetical protein